MDADNGSDTACPCPEREHEDVERYSHIGQMLDGIYIKNTDAVIRSPQR